MFYSCILGTGGPLLSPLWFLGRGCGLGSNLSIDRIRSVLRANCLIEILTTIADVEQEALEKTGEKLEKKLESSVELKRDCRSVRDNVKGISGMALPSPYEYTGSDGIGKSGTSTSWLL